MIEQELGKLQKEVNRLRQPKYLSHLSVLFGSLLVALFLGGIGYAAITLPYSFTADTTAKATEVNANFTTLLTQINSNSTNRQQVVYLKELQTSGTHGGAATATTWHTRVLNTLENPMSVDWITGPSTNQFTLTAGTYEIEAECPAYATNHNKCKLFNVTDTADSIIGASAYAALVNTGSSYGTIKGIFQIAASKTFEIRHYTVNASVTFGLGTAVSAGVSEVYTIVKLTKLAD